MGPEMDENWLQNLSFSTPCYSLVTPRTGSPVRAAPGPDGPAQAIAGAEPEAAPSSTPSFLSINRHTHRPGRPRPLGAVRPPAKKKKNTKKTQYITEKPSLETFWEPPGGFWELLGG